MIHSNYHQEGKGGGESKGESKGEGKTMTSEEMDHSKENTNTDAIVHALQPANMTHAGLYLCQMTGTQSPSITPSLIIPP